MATPKPRKSSDTGALPAVKVEAAGIYTAGKMGRFSKVRPFVVIYCVIFMIKTSVRVLLQYTKYSKKCKRKIEKKFDSKKKKVIDYHKNLENEEENVLK